MLEDILKHLNNWFVVPDGKHFGTFEVTDDGLVLPFLQNGQYFRIIGSVFNDGVYQYPANDLTKETFDGAVWALAVPRAVLKLSEEINEWQNKNGTADAYASESFGGYSYSRATDAETGGAVTWETAFRSKLNQWRKL